MQRPAANLTPSPPPRKPPRGRYTKESVCEKGRNAILIN